MRVKFKKDSLDIEVKRISAIGSFIGLMFKSKKTNNLLFQFSSNPSIHSFFVFFPFLAIWLNDNDEVVDFSVVKPFTLSVKPKNKASKLIEVPRSKKNSEIFRFFDGKRKDLNTQQ
jgi:uncharacterized membrane protein (UPF0127 family)